MDENSKLSCYNPFNAKGMPVGGSLVGIVGLGYVFFGMLLCMAIWFSARLPRFEFLNNRFFAGLWLFILFNFLGIIVLASAKIVHFYVKARKQTKELQLQRNELLKKFHALVEKKKSPIQK